MNAPLIRFCPACLTERPLTEVFCQGRRDEQPCLWTLSDEPMRPSGWRPQPVVTATAAAVATVAVAVCTEGHALDPADLICAVCGADRAETPPAPAPAAAAPAADVPTAAAAETVIDGWRLLRRLGETPRVRDRYLARRDSDGLEAVLTLYHHGAEPDPGVYDVLRRLPTEHVPAIHAVGRWNERAFEVAEYLRGGSLADLGLVAADRAAVRHIVGELSKALQSFAEVGLRHRDLRPSTLLVRSREPLDLVISGFGSAQLSDFDLDIVSPLEVTRYMAPEAIAGGVAAASDWWSLGMVLLEQITRGRCFDGVNDRAWLIHVLANGADIPADLDPSLELLLRGLLARDRHQRWQWPQVQAWLAGEPVAAPPRASGAADDADIPSVTLAGKTYRQPALLALAAAEAANWEQARDHLARGVFTTWMQQARLDPGLIAGVRGILQREDVAEDFRLMLVLKRLNPAMPLIHRGDIVTPRWLLDHPLEGYELVSGAVPDLLDEAEAENWLSQLKARASAVRARAAQLEIPLDEGSLRIYVLSSSRAKLFAEWEERRRVFPDSTHRGVQTLAERPVITDIDLIVLLSASFGLFLTAETLVAQAAELARSHGVATFDPAAATAQLGQTRARLLQAVGERVEGFATCGHALLDDWAEQFRVERRLPLARALVLLAVDTWRQPARQQYVEQILGFFEKRMTAAVMRGPLVRMTIGRTTARVDLAELGTARQPAESLLDQLLQRGPKVTALDPAAFVEGGTTEYRLQSLARHTVLYRRDTGIDGLYLGFPFLLARDARTAVKTRIAPLLLWPVRIHSQVGRRGDVGLSFDHEREEVRLNPAIEGLVGAAAAVKWREAAVSLLGRSTLRVADVIDAFGALALPRHRSLQAVPGPATELPPRSSAIECAAALFHVTFSGQAIGEDLALLKRKSLTGTALESALRIGAAAPEAAAAALREAERYFTLASDPSQEAAVLAARERPGLLVEGPPGTGKSQTIVNMVGDAIGRHRSLLLVCQKHAALEVVHKRLVAEGLGDRVVMVNDVNRDRTTIISAVRNQIQALLRRDDDPGAALRHRREAVAARLEAVQGELDRQHQALHRVDAATGLSYRALLGALLDLEAAGAPIELPALRAPLQKLSPGELAALEEEVAAPARLWLDAAYEGSPLAPLQEFAADPASIAEFEAALAALLDAERARAALPAGEPDALEVDDPQPWRDWLVAHAQRFLELDATQRQRLSDWLSWFRPAGAALTRGRKLLASLEQLAQALRGCPRQHHDARLSPLLARLAGAELAALKDCAEEAITPSPWWQRLNPARFLRRRTVAGFLARHGEPTTSERLTALARAAQLERLWQPLRLALAEANRQLGLDEIAADAGPTLHVEAANTLRALKEIAALADCLGAAPWSGRADAAARAGTAQALAELFARLPPAFARCAARARSRAALAPLQRWIGADWLREADAAIGANESGLARIQAVVDALPTLPAYQQFRQRARRLSAAALETFAVLRSRADLLRALPAGRLDAEVRRLLNREALLAWKRLREQAEPELQLGQGEIDGKIDSLARLDREMRELNREFLAVNFDLPNIEGTLKSWDEITRLRGERARRLREFIELGKPLGLMKVRPVWLMNPDVASRLLPLQAGLFDTVIYDEASQMPVEHALPTLFRGGGCVVSGDEKQMPPTAFFTSRIESDEAQDFDGEEPDEEATEQEIQAYDETWNRREIKDCPDLLQLARATLPNTALQIHYRSAYRALIDYSNACFYANKLNVPVRHPPATVRRERPIEIIRVDSVYREQTNPGEAQRVVDVLDGLWRAPYPERPSVGVVTFNRKQADLIEDCLEQRAEADADFRERYRQERERLDGEEDMGVFVKNVENVQGDERDVIVFSSTFGRNAQGTFRRTFGVLGQKGGERRLNVAVTRARRKIVMVTSMPAGEISDLLTTRRPPATPRDFLQGYMEYARALSAGEFDGAQALLRRLAGGAAERRAATPERTDDGLTRAVAAYVESLGWTVSGTQDDDAFRLDFAIEDPATGLFAIGIECDAPRHALLAGARAREVWRPDMLRKHVPVLHRVSSQAWYHTPEIERDRLRRAIERAMKPAVREIA
jgi:hypothetical protein